jgi:hypothetical protein
MDTHSYETMAGQNESYQWKIDSPESDIEIAEKLDGILASQNIEEANRVLQDPKLLHRLIIQRGEHDANLERLKGLADLIVKDEFGKESTVLTAPSAELIEALHTRDIPEQVLGDLLTTAYHQRDKVAFFHIYSLIKQNADTLQNKELIDVAEHDMASWADVVENDSEHALALNTAILEHAKVNDLKILGQKARYGITLQKNLRPKDKAHGFEKIANDMGALEHHYDAMRAHIEEIKARIELAERQTGQPEARKDSIDRCIALAHEVLEYAIKHAYGNLEVLGWEAQAYIARAVKDPRRALQFERKADLAREKFNYQTPTPFTK